MQECHHKLRNFSSKALSALAPIFIFVLPTKSNNEVERQILIEITDDSDGVFV